jgi:hypothetical protein
MWIRGLHGVLKGLLIAPIVFPRLESKSQCLNGLRLDVPTVVFISSKGAPRSQEWLTLGNTKALSRNGAHFVWM